WRTNMPYSGKFEDETSQAQPCARTGAGRSVAEPRRWRARRRAMPPAHGDRDSSVRKMDLDFLFATGPHTAGWLAPSRRGGRQRPRAAGGGRKGGPWRATDDRAQQPLGPWARPGPPRGGAGDRRRLAGPGGLRPGRCCNTRDPPAVEPAFPGLEDCQRRDRGAAGERVGERCRWGRTTIVQAWDRDRARGDGVVR